MLASRTYQYFIAGFVLTTSASCIEDIEFKTETLESALVIEATITNELKHQKIILSRTFRFEEDGPSPESGASVSITSDNGTFIFNETEPGIYISDSEFSAQQNVNYRLNIVTSNGRFYTSSPAQLTNTTQIDELYAVRETNDDGINGMSIYVDSYDPTGNSKYYRYIYEETYKIIAPAWVPEELLLIDDFTCEVALVDRTEEAKTCYNTISSLNINLINTSAFSEDRVSQHLIRFIASDDFILSHRYSIMVKQFVQSFDSHIYYKTLNEFSGEGSLFSQTQPGFFSGNIFSESNVEEKVIGFFDVSTVSEKRIYFNYEDFFEGESLPELLYACDPPIEHTQYSIAGCGTLIGGLLLDTVAYYSGASVNSSGVTIGPFFMVLKQCGDCRELGTNVVPDFWEE